MYAGKSPSEEVSARVSVAGCGHETTPLSACRSSLMTLHFGGQIIIRDRGRKGKKRVLECFLCTKAQISRVRGNSSSRSRSIIVCGGSRGSRTLFQRKTGAGSSTNGSQTRTHCNRSSFLRGSECVATTLKEL